MKNRDKCFRLAADIGGTFTDIVLTNDLTGEFVSTKVLTTPQHLTDGIMLGFDSILSGDYSNVNSIVHGTTTGLNAVIEKNGARCALVVTKGFRDVYEIGRGNRVEMYNCRYKRIPTLVSRKDIFEIDERIMSDGTILRKPTLEAMEALCEIIRQGKYEAVAICYINSYVNPENESLTAEYLKQHLDGNIVVISSYETASEYREFERLSTTVLNAYIAPKTKKHLQDLQERLLRRGYSGHLHVMQSSGGVMKAATAASHAIQTLMSGPVGGTIGAAAYERDNLIAIDMGGTSFDVSLIIHGKAETTVETMVEGFPVLTSSVNVSSIGAGGGSIAWNEAGGMRIGPQSAGANPGPVCYGQGGRLPTITDANLVLGRLDAKGFLGGKMKLDLASAKKVLTEYGRQFGLDCYTAAEGICQIANHKMADAIREITVRRGIDPRDFTIFSYGGAGSMYAAFIAKELDVKEVLIPVIPGAFSAWGMLQADIRHDAVKSIMRNTKLLDPDELIRMFEILKEELGKAMAAEGYGMDGISFDRCCDMRYLGQEYTITVGVTEAETLEITNIARRFHEMHRKLYGHANETGDIELVNIRMTAVIRTKKSRLPVFQSNGSVSPAPIKKQNSIFDGKEYLTGVYNRDDLMPRYSIEGPAIVNELTSTTIIPPEWKLRVDDNKSMILEYMGVPK